MAIIKNPFDHDIPAPGTPLVNVQLDGQWVQVPKGLNVIEVARRFEKFIPHYCYHPKLSIAGNCRMCLFEMGAPRLGPDRKPILGPDGRPEIQWNPKPQIACATGAFEGMGIRTDSPFVQECRRSVLEFLLINHPLDCPICDQAGECLLQEFAYDFGPGKSRFVEEKVKKPKRVVIGDRVILDDERCILCSRCVRFAREIAKNDVLGFVQRGSYTTLTIHPDRMLNDNYSLNTVDICPVGALTSRDFRFRMRVWFLAETKSICVDCATGCNTTIWTRENRIYRITPRVNEEVNSHWMCDIGRTSFHYIHDKRRVVQPLIRVSGELFPQTWEIVLEELCERLREHSGARLAMLVSARLTNEELYLVRKIRELLGGSEVITAVVPREGEADGILRSKDLNPNTWGARTFGLDTGREGLENLLTSLRSGERKALWVIQEDASGLGLSAEELERLSLLVWQGLLPDRVLEKSHFVLPGASFAEKDGTMVNVVGRLQRLRKAIACPGLALPDWRILAKIRALLAGKESGPPSVREIFLEMAGETPALGGVGWEKIGELGIPLSAPGL
jgi:NADH-quinone oxidoreductase subunit G